MKKTKHLCFVILCILIFTTELFSQSDRGEILATRKASNLAYKSYNKADILSFLTDDVLITAGNGTLLSGKKAIKQYFLNHTDSKIYYTRTAKEIVVNEKRGLAWESGIWDGYNPEEGSDSIISGNYSAMWTKASGVWKIKSQLFVTLD
ncbi:YybH family protein [Algibacter mikhailovii]|uniref:YybH family protein n=1 Tax=Algibacter mikhailovii TaxID=425498 RepID=UPI0024953CE4|nr:nuclear transport factor 2 family protein [Algibacter mikhailovii]